AAHFEHHAGALVPADQGEHGWQTVSLHDLVGRGHVPVADVLVGMTQAGGGHLDQHLASLGRIEFELVHGPLLTHVVQDRGATPNARGRKVRGRCFGERSGMPVILVSSSSTNCRSVTRSNRLVSIALVSTLARCMPRQLWIPPAKEMCARRGRWMS